MDKSTAQRVVEHTFKASFDRELFRDFINELTNGFDETKKQTMLIPDAFKPHVASCQRIGTYESPEFELADALIVQLTESYKLERSRTALRNFVAHKLKRGDGEDNAYKEAALVAFVSPDSKSWRFSFVRMEYETKRDPKSGKIKPEERLTPARRYSYLVGDEEQCHTAQTRFLSLLQDTKSSPTLAQIEEAFSVEKVTDEFFEQYKALFQKLAEHLKTEPWFQRDGDEERDQLVTRFAKKLLGQIVFLYFLQKKGWLGVQKDEHWGTGPKNFMRQRFEANAKAGGNYYHDCLQYLFYEALADERKGQTDPGYYARFDCRLPFLNGGLFEADYDWRNETISIPDRLFHNEDKTKSEVGTGILNVFNRYNFTIKEDEPLEKEVAVDPEMLGKVFENMLEVTERKSKGAFYTPREIVHYMCQESLIHYLEKAVGPESESEVPKSAIEWLIRKGHLALENDEIAIKAQERILQGQQKSSKHQIEAPLAIEENASDIDAALAKIKVCDPAIGSGAFPVGMLHEIVQAREVLGVLQSTPTRPYDLKKHAIGHSIYGVDIDPSAIDIARLRLWLSLIVDEDDYDEIDALPNLDYKIMQGNSLIEEFEGVKLFNETFIFEDEDTSIGEEKKRLNERRAAIQREYVEGLQTGEIFDDRRADLDQELEQVNAALNKIHTAEKKAAREKANQAESLFDLVSVARKKAKLLERRHEEFFDPSCAERKHQLREEITHLEWELIEATLHELGKTDALAKLQTLKNSGEKPYFLWKLNFSEVFRQKGGFDIVIGNPPYLGNKEIGAEHQKKFFKIFNFKDDMYSYFFIKGFDILNRGGTLGYITSNTYMSLVTKLFLRRILQKKRLLEVANVGSVFDAAIVNAAITILVNDTDTDDYPLRVYDGNPALAKTKKYETVIGTYRNGLNNVFFAANPLNLRIYNLFNENLVGLKDNYWDIVDTVKSRNRNQEEVTTRIENLEPGDTTLLGLICEGGQGLVTGNNSKYLARICNSLTEEKTLFQELAGKLATQTGRAVGDFRFEDRTEVYAVAENEKERKGNPTLFGKFFIYKTVAASEVTDFHQLSEEEIISGANIDIYVPYQRGNDLGYRWIVPVVDSICWKKECVRDLREGIVTNSRWTGESYFANLGFGWVDYFTDRIKAFIVPAGPYSKNVVKFHSKISIIYDEYMVAVLNSRFMSYFVKTFISNTHTLQVNDGKLIPIVIPSSSDHDRVVNLVRKILDKKAKSPEADVAYEEYLIDEIIFNIYGIEFEDREEIVAKAGNMHTSSPATNTI